MAADLEFFIDPVCPWCWITSRWVTEVQRQRDYEVTWRFISLAIINEKTTAEWYTPDYRAGHIAGLRALRVADAIRDAHDNAAVGRYYTALGTRIHVQRRGAAELRTNTLALIAESLAEAGLPASLESAADDESHDVVLRAETEIAFSRTGRDVGTPIMTFHPGAANEASFFGPVISKAPRGDEAVRLWDAVEVLATSSGLAELKRSLRSKPEFD
jgi:DSBA-like thioredoxin domain